LPQDVDVYGEALLQYFPVTEIAQTQAPPEIVQTQAPAVSGIYSRLI